MKSLEHIIREIHEGKREHEGKKDSLEHAIRKVARKEYESSYAAKDSKPVDEGTDHSVYHVSWGPGLDHEVVARHGEEAVSKAKNALVAKTPKLKDPKYADTFNKKPTVHNISKERNVQKEDVGGLVGSGTGGEPKLHTEDGKKKKEVDEAIGTLGTDKYQGNEFKSIRTATPHIKPPGPEHGHSQAPENASRQRSIAKEKAGINRVTEDQLDELSTEKKSYDPSEIGAGEFLSTPLFTTGVGAETGGAKSGKTKAGQPARKAPERVTPSIPKGPPIQIPGGKPSPVQPGPAPTPANVPGRETPVVPKPSIPDGTPPTRVPAKEVPKPANLPEPARPAPAKPSAPETPTPAPAPKDLPKAVPGVVPGGLPLPVPFKEPEKAPKAEPKPETAPAAQPKPQALPGIDVAAAPKAEPKVAAVPATTPATQTATTPKPAVLPDTKTPTTAAEPTKPKFPGFMGAMALPDVFGAQRGITSKHPIRSTARKERRHAKEMKEEVADKIRKKIENMPRKDAGDRKSIEYVGRSDADPKTAKERTSRLATIKNVIDEAKKVKYEAESGEQKKIVYPNGTEVVVGPNLKHNLLDVEDKKLPKDYENK